MGVFDQKLNDFLNNELVDSLVIDELGDGVEYECFSRKQLEILIRALMEKYRESLSDDIKESIFNALSSLYGCNILNDEINKFVLENINELDKNCLYHVLSILSESCLIKEYEMLKLKLKD